MEQSSTARVQNIESTTKNIEECIQGFKEDIKQIGKKTRNDRQPRERRN